MDIVELLRNNAMLQEAWDAWELGHTPVPDPLFHRDTAKIMRLAAKEIEALREMIDEREYREREMAQLDHDGQL